MTHFCLYTRCYSRFKSACARSLRLFGGWRGGREWAGGVAAIKGAVKVQLLILLYVQLIGTIPPELGSMPNLTSLRLENNMMSGTIPKSFRYDLRYCCAHIVASSSCLCSGLLHVCLVYLDVT